jgi:hypothetical protein
MVSSTLEKLIGAKFDLKTCYGLGKQLLKSVLMAKIYQGPRGLQGGLGDQRKRLEDCVVCRSKVCFCGKKARRKVNDKEKI